MTTGTNTNGQTTITTGQQQPTMTTGTQTTTTTTINAVGTPPSNTIFFVNPNDGQNDLISYCFDLENSLLSAYEGFIIPGSNPIAYCGLLVSVRLQLTNTNNNQGPYTYSSSPLSCIPTSQTSSNSQCSVLLSQLNNYCGALPPFQLYSNAIGIGAGIYFSITPTSSLVGHSNLFSASDNVTCFRNAIYPTTSSPTTRASSSSLSATGNSASYSIYLTIVTFLFTVAIMFS